MTSSSIILFSFNAKDVRVSDQNGDPWFILRDLLEAMETSTPVTVAIESIKQGLGEGFNDVIPLQTAGGTQQTIVVHESAATYLLSRSNTEKGRELNRFIHVEVLPQIRKTGRYEKTFESDKPKPSLILEWWRLGLTLADDCSLKGNQRLLSADKAVKAQVGLSALGLIGQTHLPSETQKLHYTPTEIGEMMNPPISAIKVNNALVVVGLQEKKAGRWSPTEAGLPYAMVMDTGKKNSSGTPVEQVKWTDDVVSILGQKEAA
jgi:prophage antirepressor-like protein